MNAVELRNVSKRFKRYFSSKRQTTLKSALIDMLRGKGTGENGDYLWALRNVSLDVPQGMILGIIGRNGSGKSTLLKILAGIYAPNSGSVSVHGRVAALIELGAGFHPELSGRENVFINGMILGLSRKEIKRKFDEIVAFAELENSIDAPVRTYSSGMYARLGFSVAINVNPDILLVDEILSVGDESFVKKCSQRMGEFIGQGKTLIIVTHDLLVIESFCRSALWIEEGETRSVGTPKEVVSSYKEFLFASDGRKTLSHREKRWGDGRIEILDIKCLNDAGSETYHYATGQRMTVLIRYRIHREVADAVMGIGIFRNDGVWCYGTNTMEDGISPLSLKEEGRVRVEVESLDLLSGTYFLDVAVHDRSGYAYDYRSQAISIMVSADTREGGVMRLKHRWIFE